MSVEQQTPHEESDSVTETPPTFHLLPCSVDFSGRVPAAQHFFQPTYTEGENTDDIESKGRILAATFRGRGLLGQEVNLDSSSDDNDSPGPALAMFKVHAADQALALEGTPTTRAVEWHHEHVAENLNHGKSKRLVAAQSWFQVARALHEPLAPPEEF